MPSTGIDRIDGNTTSVAVKAPCTVIAKTPIILSGIQTIDGVVLQQGDGGQMVPDRVLVAGQADQTQNGIYLVNTGAWVRAYDFDGARDGVTGTLIFVRNGTANGQTWWRLATTDNPIEIGISHITFTQSFTEGGISTAMLPVVAAPTLAAARTALGLGSAAVENLLGVIIDSGGSLTIQASGITYAMLSTSALNQIYANALASANALIAGGYVNKFYNGGFDVAQLGTSGTITTGTSAYTLDGWIVGATGATLSWSQVYGSAGGMNGNFLRLQGATSMTDSFYKQRIESTIAAALAGRQVTVQFLINNALASAGITPVLTVKHANARDDWSGSTTDVSAVSLQTVANNTTAVVAYTFACPANGSNGLEVTLDLGASLNSSSNILNIRNADIRPTPGIATGLNASPPAAEIRPVSTETQFAQRYLSKSYDLATAPGTVTTNGQFYHNHNGSGSGTLQGGGDVRLPVMMWKQPALTFYSPATGTSGKIRDLQNATDITPTTVGNGQMGFSWNGTNSSASTNCFFSGHFVADARL